MFTQLGLDARRVLAHQFSEHRHAFGCLAWQCHASGKAFEAQMVAVAAKVKAEPEHHRNAQRRRDAPWRDRKRRAQSQQWRIDGCFSRARAISEDGDQGAFVSRFDHAQHDRCRPLGSVDHLRAQGWSQRLQQTIQGGRLLAVKHEPQSHLRSTRSKDAQRLEAAYMRPQKQGSVAISQRIEKCVKSTDLQVEVTLAVREEEDPIQCGCCKRMEVPKDLTGARRPPEQLLQIRTRCAPLRASSRKKIEGDWIQQQPGGHAAKANPDATDEPEREPPASLAPPLP